ncbi:DUF4062 domain-containing protein [Ahrensia sp. R2A130]|uniref:DUF4062 domain-containing protein n=1 Tax=Ahrensia sp. R2A130 TaxID=744979 RepID=UPI0001E08445|nr:DUF4062 domain-containing protein [Ahrensia sp. R2A130]EFL88096.1 conserved hypothetical protein [Ahrensia sp. R2A130]
MKKYEVFISSTFKDLRKERQAVQDVVIRAGDFPVQMESFPASDQEQFEYIKTLIDSCDYYVLIIAGRYGTQSKAGLSYTHREYQYAVSSGVPVLAFIHGNLPSISAKKSETTLDGKAALQKFIGEVEKGRLRRSWTDIGSLKLAVREALDHAKAISPRTGWVSAATVSSADVLADLHSFRKENDRLKAQVGELIIDFPLPDIPSPTDTFGCNIGPVAPSGFATQQGSFFSVRINWTDMFIHFHRNLSWSSNDWNGEDYYYVNEEESMTAIGSSIAKTIDPMISENLFSIFKADFDRIKSYYLEAGLFTEAGGQPFTEMGNKISRRQQISGNSDSSLEIVSGTLKVSPISVAEADDDIPF